MLSALRYARPGASVHLLAGMRPGSAKPAIPEILVEHGIAADLQIIPIGAEPFGSTLLARAHDVGADMLVMGAPGKPRRPVSAEEKARFEKGVGGYVERGRQAKEEPE